ncbi:MAG: DIP1984 family protein [Gracilibacteraceae bacterium]|jgi:hypothetical protein|nr:DIP1984 family protein [Gracilibacteraceae bacterium]
MKLAEALIQRADAQTKLSQLKTRMQNNIKVQEGEKPAESFAELLSQYNALAGEFTALAKCINKTNAATPMDSGTIADAITEGGNGEIKSSFLSFQKTQILSTVARIQSGAIRRCENLAMITIPDSVTSIEDF